MLGGISVVQVRDDGGLGRVLVVRMGRRGRFKVYVRFGGKLEPGGKGRKRNCCHHILTCLLIYLYL